jgi:hypothetical protein
LSAFARRHKLSARPGRKRREAARGCSCIVAYRHARADHAAAWLLVAGVAFAVRLRRRLAGALASPQR